MNIRVFGFYDGSKAKCLGGHTKITTFSLKSYLITKLRSRQALPGSFKNSSVPRFGMMQKKPSDLRPVNSVGNLGWSASKHVFSCNVTMSHKAVISTNVMPRNRNDTVSFQCKCCAFSAFPMMNHVYTCQTGKKWTLYILLFYKKICNLNLRDYIGN